MRTMALKRERRINVMGLELTVAMDLDRAERVRTSLLYQKLIRPALDRLSSPSNGREGQSSEPEPMGVAGAADVAAENPLAREILERCAGIDWYHSLDLPHGVVTPGYVDHREQVDFYGLPQDMRGLRAIDVATYDGFWAFEMERRGAEVVGIDIESMAECDYPRRFREQALAENAGRKTGAGFAAASELLGSNVERKLINVYDLSREQVGTFDVALVSDLLLHLRDPALALEKVCSVLRPGGFAIVAEPFSPELDRFKQPLSQFGYAEALGWWQHSAETLRTMMWAAGFDDIEELARFRLNCKAAAPITKVVLKGHIHTGESHERGR